MKASVLLAAVVGAAGIAAQGNSTGNATLANGCNPGFYPGNDTYIYSTPYTYAQVMSIIGDYQNLTWSGSPAGSVTLNGTDNTVGTARTYDIAGAHIVETIEVYSKPPNGPYVEIHAVDLLTIPAANVSVYSNYDGTTVTPICDGAASTLNFTVNFCATNAPVAAAVLHTLRVSNVQTLGQLLGGQNFTSCSAVASASSTVSVRASTSSSPAQVTASGATAHAVSLSTVVLVAGGLLAWVGL